MADGKELKPKSFRIDDETAEKFKEIAVAIGGNQQETLAKLIETYEFQSGKAKLTEKKSIIEDFEKYVTILTNMFMRSLEDNQEVKNTVRIEFDALLTSKDTTIAGLKEKLEVAKKLKEEATSKAKSYADENAKLHNEIDKLNNEYTSKIATMQSNLTDKDHLNKSLTTLCNELETKLEGMKETVEQSISLQEELDQLKKQHEKAKQEQLTMEKQLQQEQATNKKVIPELKQHEKDALKHQKEQLQLEHDKTVLQIQKEHQEQIQRLKSDTQKEIDKYQQKYFELLEQLKEQAATAAPSEN